MSKNNCSIKEEKQFLEEHVNSSIEKCREFAEEKRKEIRSQTRLFCHENHGGHVGGGREKKFGKLAGSGDRGFLRT